LPWQANELRRNCLDARDYPGHGFAPFENPERSRIDYLPTQRTVCLQRARAGDPERIYSNAGEDGAKQERAAPLIPSATGSVLRIRKRVQLVGFRRNLKYDKRCLVFLFAFATSFVPGNFYGSVSFLHTHLLSF